MVMSELFGSMVFNEQVMSERLPKNTYKEFKDCCAHDRPLPLETANVIANAMKDWAVEKGVTHFTHWFQPMTGLSAEKHDSFISPTPDGGVIMEFGGKELIKGEPDASSFPSGGLRATFEARGYTAWDPTSYAFIKDNTLCIPTAFCSYNGQALDKKTPLLRSMEAVSREGVALLRLFGRKTEKLYSAVGPEQEYFLIDSKSFEKRRDLMYTGRTLFGAKPPKGQELEDHYFGAIKPRVAAFMKDLDEELWKLGVLAKTKHNEVAPAQHELAPIYTTVNVATDQNQLTMETMRKVAAKHGMTCLLHEKPFAGVNGSGKHNNWSLVTNFGHNIFEPGKSPSDNAQFLLIVSLMIAAVDKHQDLLRISAASAGNDHRLGANEAPPAIVSMYLGDELTGILQAIADGRTYSKRAACEVEIGVHVLPKFAMDSTDRNRTSPLAFTGNKFEFRMLGSAFSIADTNTVLNTIMADEFRAAAAELAEADDFNACIRDIIKRIMNEHGRIVFNGNNYSAEWVEEAKRRGLLNLPTTVDCLELLDSPENIALFERNGVFTEEEIRSRKDILIENYSKQIAIEANTMLDMAEKDVLPAVTTYERELADTVGALAAAGVTKAPQKDTLKLLNALYTDAAKAIASLKAAIEKGKKAESWMEYGRICRDEIIPAMNALRAAADEMEIHTAKKYWPFPTYGDLLFSVN
ncbi:MAG TPA: glutamine synthetase III [Candidatus Limadaptatus stercorigallinarum]|uniref:Glutamine synthetase III n=1 Tax=Candidatus Limadaptatus stercorigallinarum TaxID=2840845 RepID=A0A9D1HST9_9FIRM|nr:glutamine synthetase III [Candidatus Limadaptatus stercorigallinarum]